MHVLLRIPGLGMVKAGFILQFMGFDVGCLDTRNIQRERIDINATRIRKDLSPRAQARRLAWYLRETGGRAQELWDGWCQDVAGTYGTFQDADSVSRVHLDCIVPKGWPMPAEAPCVPYLGVPDEIPF
jgi:hypothetical protein